MDDGARNGVYSMQFERRHSQVKEEIVHRRQCPKAADHAAEQAAISQKAAARENAVRLMMRASLNFVDISAKVDALHRQLDNANRAGLTGHPMWARVPGIFGGTRLQLFEVSELSPFLNAGEVAVVSRCVELGLQHQVLIETIERYNQGRSKLKELLPPEALANGSLLTPANQALLLRLTPYTDELDSLISIFKGRAEKQLERARELNVIVGEAGTRLFGASFPRVNPKALGATTSSQQS